MHTYNYNIILAGDPFFDGEQPAQISGTACIEKDGLALGLVDLSQLPPGYIVHHQRLETITDTGVRQIAGLTLEPPNKIKFNTESLSLKPL